MIVCTVTPPPDVLARLAACPALPRGERLEWAVLVHPREFCPCCFKRAYNIVNDASCSTLLKQWRSMARPLRVARERLRGARESLSSMSSFHCVGDPCMICKG